MQTPELNKWYEEKELGYFIKPFFRGTDILVRGNLSNLTEFLFQLERTYHPNSKDDIFKNYEILRKVLVIGKTHNNPGGIIGFGDDRIRIISRMDDPYIEPAEDPYLGSQEHLELTHNEQWGCSSRAWMIDNSMKAISNMRPKKDREYNSIVDKLLTI